jgi:hypothetical protein
MHHDSLETIEPIHRRSSQIYETSEHEANMQALFAATELEGAQKIVECWREVYAEQASEKTLRKATKAARREQARQGGEVERTRSSSLKERLFGGLAHRRGRKSLDEVTVVGDLDSVSDDSTWTLGKRDSATESRAQHMDRRIEEWNDAIQTPPTPRNSEEAQATQANDYDYATWIQNERGRKKSVASQKSNKLRKSQDTSSTGRRKSTVSETSGSEASGRQSMRSKTSEDESLYGMGIEKSPGSLAGGFEHFRNALGLKRSPTSGTQ